MVDPELPFDAGNVEAVKDRNRDLRIAEKDRKDMIAAIMGMRQGRSYFFELLEFCGVGRNPFTSNALTTSYQCGLLNAGQKVYADITATVPDLYLLMMREATERTDALEINKASPANGSGQP